MLNILSLLIGVLSLVIALVGLIPLLGWLNYLAIPLAIVGAALGVVSEHKSGRNLNVLVVIVGAVRLFIGGGLL